MDDPPTVPVRTVAHWLPVTGGGWRRRPIPGKGRISTSRYHKRPRRIVATGAKLRWLWRRRYGTTAPMVWSPGMLADAPAIRTLIDRMLRDEAGLERRVTVWGLPVVEEP